MKTQKRHKKCYIGWTGTHYYRIVYDQRENQSYCDPEFAKDWRWFLWANPTNNPPDNIDYVGDFSTQKEALETLC